MSVFGQSWRVAHGAAGLLTIGAVLLTADFVARRFPIPQWRVPGALTAAVLTCLNAKVFMYGPLGHAYGMCLVSLARAVRISVRAVESKEAWMAGAAGRCAGIAAGSLLLTAIAWPA